jgi:hypothetical protein
VKPIFFFPYLKGPQGGKWTGVETGTGLYLLLLIFGSCEVVNLNTDVQLQVVIDNSGEVNLNGLNLSEFSITTQFKMLSLVIFLLGSCM